MAVDGGGAPAGGRQDTGDGLIHEPQTNEEYTVQRVRLATDYPVDNFHNDLCHRRPGFCGFHIWGSCPNCNHPTNGLLPTKYLKDDMEGALSGAKAEAV